MNGFKLYQQLESRVGGAVYRFFATPASAKPMAVFRIGLALVLLGQGWALAGNIGDLFGPEGLIRWDVTYNANDPSPMAWAFPHLSWITGALAPLGLSDTTGVMIVFAAYLAALFFLLIGCGTRVACWVTFILQIFLSNSAPATVYGVDSFARVSLFYALWMPLGAAYSVDAWWGCGGANKSIAARIGLRMLQLHLAFMYLASGIEKGMGAQWWNGEAIWRAVTMPELAQFDLTWLAQAPWLPMFLGWSTVIAEVAYIALVCHRRTRVPAVLSVISMHVGIALFMGLVSFASLMIVLNVAAFLVPANAEPESADGELSETQMDFAKPALSATA